MAGADIYRQESSKSLSTFLADLSREVSRRGFHIHNEERMDMARTFGAHGVAMAAEFDLHMIQICKPAKAGESLGRNPERAPLMPKFIMAFSRDGRTHVRLLRYHAPLIEELVDDPEFAVSLAESFDAITGMIDAAA
jgi:uncharacterized protein (DUF302 family)